MKPEQKEKFSAPQHCLSLHQVFAFYGIPPIKDPNLFIEYRIPLSKIQQVSFRSMIFLIFHQSKSRIFASSFFLLNPPLT
ncbi:MAG: hypothetical protein ACK56I_25045, partial [bacterium]